MLRISFDDSSAGPFKVLCLGAHSDDIEIGCGGTILRLTREYEDTEFHWVVFSAGDEQRKEEAIKTAELTLKDATSKTIVTNDFQDSFFPYAGREIKTYFQEIRAAFSPHLVFTHYRHDLHQDHRLLNELTWNTFRDHLILEYEIPKYDGDLGNPNFYVPIDESTAQEKINIICSGFRSQQSKPWFDEETFRALLRLRGIESGSGEKYAEAFHGRKVALG